MTDRFASRLLRWFDAHGRKDLPWQNEITPYRVWLSEIMLQQTQVSTVIPYFRKFTEAFPDIHQLAAAPLDEVLHLWTGLGYYARARNLHKSAGIISKEQGGQFPGNVEELSALPGIGRSTAGAIVAIAFRQPAVILDGNVKRVLARYHAIDGWPGQTAVAQKLWHRAEQHTPRDRTADYTQAIMDLGATVCTRSSPRCGNCPLTDACLARQQGTPQNYPGKKPATEKPVKRTRFLLIQNRAGNILLQQRPPTGLWGGLWTFPECDNEADIEIACARLGCEVLESRPQPPRRHSFSHFHLDYTPVRVSVESRPAINENSVTWWQPGAPAALGLPAPVKALLDEL